MLLILDLGRSVRAYKNNPKIALLDNGMNTIIIRRALLKRWCWNWQTGMVEGHVSQDVEVQVLSSAPMQQKSPEQIGDFLF
jgi:hypothetical protein